MGAVEAFAWGVGRGSDGARCLQRVGRAVEEGVDVLMRLVPRQIPDRSGAREVGAVLIWEGAVLVVGVSGQSDEGVVALDTVSGG